MSKFKVRVLYDFKGESNTAELSVSEGEILNVTRTDVGEGWWEGTNSRGQSGLFPEAYVERIETGPPNIPAPALPNEKEWGIPGLELPTVPTEVTAPAGNNQAHQNEDWDDEWDDDTYSEIPNSHNGGYQPKNNQSYYGNSIEQQNQNYNAQFSNLHRQMSQNADAISLSGSIAGDNKGPVTKKSLNIFSAYVKSGLEAYILGTTKDVTISISKRIKIYRDSDDVLGRWEPISNPYTVQITSPKKATKMGGLKSFIAYQLTPSFTNIEVSRRYKHFDWLHDRLTEKFNLIAIPPLPDKQVSGRYEEMFIEHRRAQLQEFINYMCRHPVLSTCDVWIHFLTCTDEKQWKQGKRNAEKDQLIGASFCLALDAPDKEILTSLVDSKIDENMRYIEKMDQCIKNLMQTAVDQQKKYENMYKREFIRVGEMFFALGGAFEYGQKGMYSKASLDVKNIGSTYTMIGKLFEEQSKIDWQPLYDSLYLYKGITSNLPNVLHMQKMAEQKKRDCEKNTPINQLVLTDIRRRSDVVTYAVFAEMQHFQQERDQDLKRALKEFLKEQLNFYKNIVGKLQDTLDQFE